MKGLVFDIETVDIVGDTRKGPEDLTLSVVGVYSYPHKTYKAFTEDTLDELWTIMRDIDTLIGFNSNHFDIPILNKYSPIDLKKEYKSIDLLENVREALGRRIKLDWIAEGTLGIKKSGHGLQAVEWWKNGEYEKVKKYCLDDVKITKEIFEWAKKNKELKYNDFGTIHTIQINTDNWDEDLGVNNTSVSLF